MQVQFILVASFGARLHLKSDFCGPSRSTLGSMAAGMSTASGFVVSSAWTFGCGFDLSWSVPATILVLAARGLKDSSTGDCCGGEIRSCEKVRSAGGEFDNSSASFSPCMLSLKRCAGWRQRSLHLEQRHREAPKSENSRRGTAEFEPPACIAHLVPGLVIDGWCNGHDV